MSETLAQRIASVGERYTIIKQAEAQQAAADKAAAEQAQAREAQRLAAVEGERARVEAERKEQERRTEETRRDPIKSFAVYVADSESAIDQWLSAELIRHKEQVDSGSTPLWGLLYVESFDVKKSDSLITPVVGEIECTWYSTLRGEYSVTISCAPTEAGWAMQRLNVRWKGKKGMLDPDNDSAMFWVKRILRESGVSP